MLLYVVMEKEQGLTLRGGGSFVLHHPNNPPPTHKHPPQPHTPTRQRALSTKTEFFARVSHEFRTPLNIILGFAEEIQRRPLSPYVQERIGYIITSGESLLRIVDDILEVR